MSLILQGVFVGCSATILLDIWAFVAKTVLKLPAPNWGFVGRWIGHMKNGQFFHHPIASSPAVPGEHLIGWIFHYIIGAVYGVCYLSYLYVAEAASNPASAIIVAWAFLAAPWLVMQPGLGMGVFSSKTPKPGLMRIVTIIAHTIFGIGLYLGARFIGL